MEKKNTNAGFSLVELIVVIAIMAILVAVLAPTLISKKQDSKETTTISTTSKVRHTAENAMGTEAVYDAIVPAKTEAGTATAQYTIAKGDCTVTAGDGAPDGADVTKLKDELDTIIGSFKFKSKELKGTDGIKITVTEKGKVTAEPTGEYTNTDFKIGAQVSEDEE